MKKRTDIYIDGRKVKRKDLRIKGLDRLIASSRNMCFLPDMKTERNYTLTNGMRLKIVSSSGSYREQMRKRKTNKGAKRYGKK